MRCGMTPAGVPAYEKNMYLAEKGHLNFSPQKITNINSVIKCRKIPNSAHQMSNVILSMKIILNH